MELVMIVICKYLANVEKDRFPRLNDSKLEQNTYRIKNLSLKLTRLLEFTVLLTFYRL